jgi:hypothetical protein
MAHELYTSRDFTNEEYGRGNALAIAVIDGGLGVCKRCGASEAELEEWSSCADYNQAVRRRREGHRQNRAHHYPAFTPPHMDQSGWTP